MIETPEHKFEIRKQELTSSHEQLKVFAENIIAAQDKEALELFIQHHAINEILNIKELFRFLIEFVRNDKYFDIVKILCDEIDFKNIKDSDNGGSLLHEAAPYGAIKTVKFLVNKNFDINALNNNRSTPLHNAILCKSLETAKFLIENEANLNIKDKSGLYPITLSVVSGQNEITNLLLQSKRVDTGVTYKDKTWIQLAKLHKAGLIDNNYIPPQEIEIKNLEYFKGTAEFYKALFLSVNNRVHFINAIDHFNKFLIKNTSDIHKEFAHSTIFNLIQIHELFKYENSDKLQHTIIKQAKAWGFVDHLAALFNIVCVEYLNTADYTNALKYGELAYGFCEKKSFKNYDLKGKVCFNLGLCWQHFDTFKGLDFLNKAEKLISENTDIKILKLNLYIRSHDYDNALIEANKIKESDFKDLALIYLHSRLKDEKNFKLALDKYHFSRFNEENTKSSNEKYLIYLDICAEINKMKKEYGKAIEINKKIISFIVLEKIPFSFTNQMSSILEIFQIQKKWKEGLNLIKECYQNYSYILNNHNNLLLKYHEFVFYLKSDDFEQADKALEFLNTHAKLGNYAASLAKTAKWIYFYTLINNKDYDPEKLMISDILSDENKSKFQHLISRLQKKQKDAQNHVATIEDKLSGTECSPLDSINERTVAEIEWSQNASEIEEYLPDLSPKEIHKYFQEKKRALLKHEAKDIISEKNTVSWISEDGTYYSSINVCAVEGKSNYYSTIQSKIIDTLTKGNKSSKTLEQFKLALTKAVTREHGSNGIKFLNHKLIELKINADVRLFTNKIYKNSKGEYLIIFTNYGTHQDVIKALKNSKSNIKIIECQDFESLNVEENNHNEIVTGKLEEDLSSSIVDEKYMSTPENADEYGLIGDHVP